MQSYSTTGLTRRDGSAFWMDAVCRTYTPVACAFGDDVPFQASLDVSTLGRAELTRVVSTPVRYERTRDVIRKDDHGDYVVSLVKRGEMHVRQNERATRIEAGDLCLFDTSQPYHLNCPDRYEAIHLKIARHELDRRLPAAEKVSAMRVAGDGRYARLATIMLQSTLELISGDRASGRRVAPSLIDLIGLAFDECFNTLDQDNARYARIVARAQDTIRARLLEPDFDIATVPAAIGVSARTLNRAFAQQGITPAKWMWTKRLDEARNLLLTGRGQSVSDVAMACGFNDFSHFSRAFKARFNVTPTVMRADA